MRISDWSSDVCSSDLVFIERVEQAQPLHQPPALGGAGLTRRDRSGARHDPSVERLGRCLAFSDKIVGRHHIGERLIVQAIGDTEPGEAGADGEHEKTLAGCEASGGDDARSGDVRSEEKTCEKETIMRIAECGLCQEKKYQSSN